MITRDNLCPLVDALNTQLSSQETMYKTEMDNLQARIGETEKQRKKTALLDQKRQLEANGSASVGAEPITDAKLDDYIARVRDVLLGGDNALARRILDHFVDHVSVKKDSTTGTLYYTFPSVFLRLIYPHYGCAPQRD